MYELFTGFGSSNTSYQHKLAFALFLVPLECVPMPMLSICLRSCGMHSAPNEDTGWRDFAIIEAPVLYTVLFWYACNLTAGQPIVQRQA